MDLTEFQWKCVEPLLPEMRWREGGPGRPPRDRRTVLNGILGVLRTGAPWKDLPDRYPSHQTCHRRFQHWCRNGTLDRILEALAKDLQKWGRIDLTEGFIDGSFAGAKKGGSCVGKTKRGKDQAPVRDIVTAARVRVSKGSIPTTFHLHSSRRDGGKAHCSTTFCRSMSGSRIETRRPTSESVFAPRGGNEGDVGPRLYRTG